MVVPLPTQLYANEEGITILILPPAFNSGMVICQPWITLDRLSGTALADASKVLPFNNLPVYITLTVEERLGLAPVPAATISYSIPLLCSVKLILFEVQKATMAVLSEAGVAGVQPVSAVLPHPATIIVAIINPNTKYFILLFFKDLYRCFLAAFVLVYFSWRLFLNIVVLAFPSGIAGRKKLQKKTVA